MVKLTRNLMLLGKCFYPEITLSFSPRFYSVKTQLEEPSSHTSPLEVFERKVADGKLKADAKQHSVVQALQQVYENIYDYTPIDQQNIFSKLFTLRSENDRSPKGLYIHGAVGGGKTMLMDLFYSCCETEQKQRVHFHSFMIDIHKRIHNTKVAVSGDPIPFVADSISEKQWLICFDEFQVTDIADAMILRHLFTRLFENGVVVVATSNRAPDELYKNGLQRCNFLPFIDILKDHCNVANLDSGIDYRSLKSFGVSDKSYYFVDNVNSVKKMFKFLCSKENDTLRPKTLRIQGRNVEFSITCGQILFATFDELCNRALGANDYLHLAQAFHTIFITDVPQLTTKLESQARRFITLIDTLYDQKTRLVVSTQHQVETLFITPKKAAEGEEVELSDHQRMLMDDLKIDSNSEGRQANVFTGDEELFAFARTMSRLNEMKTESYWKSCSRS